MHWPQARHPGAWAATQWVAGAAGTAGEGRDGGTRMWWNQHAKHAEHKLWGMHEPEQDALPEGCSFEQAGLKREATTAAPAQHGRAGPCGVTGRARVKGGAQHALDVGCRGVRNKKRKAGEQVAPRGCDGLGNSMTWLVSCTPQCQGKAVACSPLLPTSSASNKAHQRGPFTASEQGGRPASRQAGKQASRQASPHRTPQRRPGPLGWPHPRRAPPAPRLQPAGAPLGSASS